MKIERPCDFDFHAGDYIYVNIPEVAKFEWHPFTISSAPEDEDYITLHVRVAGGWTGRLYSICQEDAERLLRQHSLHIIAQQQMNANKLNPFTSLVLTDPREVEEEDAESNVVPVTPSCSSVSSSVTAGQDNLAYQSECSSPSLSDSGVNSIEVTSRSTSVTVSRMPSSQLPRYEVNALKYFRFLFKIFQDINSECLFVFSCAVPRCPFFSTALIVAHRLGLGTAATLCSSLAGLASRLSPLSSKVWSADIRVPWRLVLTALNPVAPISQLH